MSGVDVQKTTRRLETLRNMGKHLVAQVKHTVMSRNKNHQIYKVRDDNKLLLAWYPFRNR